MLRVVGGGGPLQAGSAHLSHRVLAGKVKLLTVAQRIGALANINTVSWGCPPRAFRGLDSETGADIS